MKGRRDINFNGMVLMKKLSYTKKGLKKEIVIRVLPTRNEKLVSPTTPSYSCVIEEDVSMN